MEQDKQLKEILQNSAEAASAGFTDAVMKQVHQHSILQKPYLPLVPSKAKKIFVLVFTALIAAITALCLLMGLLRIEEHIQNVTFPELNYNRIIVSILLFWTLFIANALLQKRFRLKKHIA
jgi:hypothetical protein